ncbi:MAG: hypothetical protein ACTHVE_06630 [Senegalia sp. (in: firmicutes)]|uniref:hypothetical protein n=1 Tax=Senegalia sp. (in: firmicutes) TaxID=1924098 RepID=UPI003F9B8E6D
MKFLKLLLLIILISIIVIGVLAFSGENIESTKKLDEEFLIDRVVFKSNLDIYNKNTVSFTEEEVNGLLAKRLVDRLNSNMEKNKEIKNVYLNLKDGKIVTKASFKNSPFILIMDLNISLDLDRNTLNFKVADFKIGKLPLPNSLLNSFGLKDINDSLYLNINKLEEIDILDINLNEENIEISYKTNNDKIIEKYVPKNQKEFIKEIESLLEKSETSKKLANNIVRAALLYGTETEMPGSLIDDLENNFISLDNKTKANLVFTMLKYNIDYFVDILLK